MLALAGLLALASRSSALAPDFLTEFVLYALSATNLTMLVALVFVLARNIVKLVVERRRALPFARFRAKLVTVLLGMTLIPGGARADRRQRADSQQRGPLVQRADGRGAVVGQRDRRRLLRGAAAARLGAGAAAGAGARPRSISLRPTRPPCAIVVAPDVLQERVELVEVYRVERAGRARPPGRAGRSTSPRRRLPREYSRASADRLAERAVGRRRRSARGRAAAGRRRADSHGDADPVVAARARARRRDRQRVPDRPVRRAGARHDRAPTRATSSCAC